LTRAATSGFHSLLESSGTHTKPALFQWLLIQVDPALKKRILVQLQPRKPAHRLDLVQRVFHRQITQGVLLLREVVAQHD
jgi:hypothetical protein